MSKDLQALIRMLDVLSMRLPYQLEASIRIAEHSGDCFWSGVYELYGEIGVRILIHALLVRNNNRSHSFYARKK